MSGGKRMKNKILAIIPARGGSKGIPRKNIKLLDGKPLIAYSIEAALTSKIDKVIVSTEDEEIAEISRKYCAEVIEGPKELAKDETSTIDALKHVIGALREKDNYRPAISFFYTSYPTKKVVDIINAIDFLRECGKS
jgi:CMP-N-acetylneuraminic acid synthetase